MCVCVRVCVCVCVCVFSRPRRPDRLYPSASNEETIETSAKIITTPAVKGWERGKKRKEKGIRQRLDERVFRGTGMKTTLTLESLASQCDLRLVDSLVPWWDTGVEWGTKQKQSKEEEAGNIQGGSERFLETF